MGRRRSPQVIQRAIRVYKYLLSIGQRITTPELFKRAHSDGIISDYSKLYQSLRLLKKVGLVDQRSRGIVSEWEVIRVVDDEEELYRILSGSRPSRQL